MPAERKRLVSKINMLYTEVRVSKIFGNNVISTDVTKQHYNSVIQKHEMTDMKTNVTNIKESLLL